MLRTTLESALFCLCLSPLLVAQHVNQPVMPDEPRPALEAPQTEVPASSVRVRIPMYTRVDLQLEQRISSADAHVGDRVRFTLVNDLAVKGRVVAQAGTSCYATIKGVRPRSDKKNGSVKLSDPELDLGHGKRIRLTDMAPDAGDDVEMAVAFLTAAAISSPIWVPELLFESISSAFRPHPSVTHAKRPDPADYVIPEGRHLVFVTQRAVRIRVDTLPAQSPVHQ